MLPTIYPPASRHDGVEVLRCVQVRDIARVQDVVDVLEHDLVYYLHVAGERLKEKDESPRRCVLDV